MSAYVCKLDPQGNFLWAKQFGAIPNMPQATYCYGMQVSSTGAIYLTGLYYGITDFDPGANMFLLVAQNGSNGFVLKLDAQGNFVWAKQFNSEGSSAALGLAIDPQDNVYTTGHFTDTTDFDPGAPTFTLDPTGNLEAFVCKLDAQGSFVWVRSLTTTSGAGGQDVALDASGNVYSTGSFVGISDFDAGAGSYTLASNAGTQDIYVTKMDASGNFIWALQMGGSDVDGGNALAIDPLGNTYVTGFYRSSVDFDPGPGSYSLTSNGNYDIFTLKLNPAGNMLWATSVGGTGIDVASSIITDAAGSLYSTGEFENSVDFDPGSGSTTFSTAGQSIYISKLTAQGNLQWAKELSGATYGAGTAIALDAANSVYTAGSFSNTVDFDPNAGTYALTAFAGTDIYVHKLVCGNPPDVTISSSSGIICAGNSATLTATGATSYTWVAGPGNNSLVVNPATTTGYTVSGSDANGCMSEASITQSVSACTGLQQLAGLEIAFDIYPNPSRGRANVEIPEELLNGTTIMLRVLNTAGQLVLEKEMMASHNVLDLTALPAGLYLVNLDAKEYGTLRAVKLVKE